MEKEIYERLKCYQNYLEKRIEEIKKDELSPVKYKEGLLNGYYSVNMRLIKDFPELKKM